MGNDEFSMNVFICGNLTNGILENVVFKIFEKKIRKKSESKFESKNYDFDVIFSHNRPLENYEFYWIGHLFRKGDSSNLIKDIGIGIQKMVFQYKKENKQKIDIRRNNVILFFLKENEDSSIIENPIKSMNEKKTLVEVNNPIIITVGGKNEDNDFEKIKFINKLPGGNNDDILRNVHSKLLTIDAYLNERGNIFDNIVYRNLGKFERNTATTCLDILIFGDARSGKSTFINILSNSLLAREQLDAETCTTKCTEFIIPFENINNAEHLENQALEQINQYNGKLKIIDTPGFLYDADVSKVCGCLNNYIYNEVEIIQLALFFINNTNVLGKSNEVIKILLNNNIPVFFVKTHSLDKDTKLEDSIFYKHITDYIYNNFNEDTGKLLIKNGKNEVYNIIRINQKKDEGHKTIFGIDILLEKILHFFLYEKMKPLLQNNLNNEQNFIQQKNILLSCFSDLSSNYLTFSLHNLLFRKFLTLANVSDYFYRKAIALVTAANFLCCASCIIPIPFIDLPIYYSIHYSMMMGILSVFGIKLTEVDVKTIMITNGANLGGDFNNVKTAKKIINIGLKILLNSGKYASDMVSFIPFFGIFGKGIDLAFSAIDTSVLGRNLIKSCNSLPKNQQFFKNELEKFNYILSKLEAIKLRIQNNHDNLFK